MITTLIISFRNILLLCACAATAPTGSQEGKSVEISERSPKGRERSDEEGDDEELPVRDAHTHLSQLKC